jgi:hypothetical protein
MYIENPTTRPRRIFDEDVEMAALVSEEAEEDVEMAGLASEAEAEGRRLEEALALPVGNVALEVDPVLLTTAALRS